MKQIQKIILSLCLFFSLLLPSFVVPKTVRAADTCSGVLEGVNVTLPGYTAGMKHTIKFDTTSWSKDYTYFLAIRARSLVPNVFGNVEADSTGLDIDHDNSTTNSEIDASVSGNILTFEIKGKSALQNGWASGDFEDTHYVEVHRYKNFAAMPDWTNHYCSAGTYTTVPILTGCKITIYQNRPNPGGGTDQACYLGGENSCLQMSDSLSVNAKVENLRFSGGEPFNGQLAFVWGQPGIGVASDSWVDAVDGTATAAFTPDTYGEYTLQVRMRRVGVNYDIPGCKRSIEIKEVCQNNQCNTNPTSVDTSEDLEIISTFELCSQISNDALRGKCEECAGGVDGRAGVWTAVGCIEREPQSIVRRVIEIGLGAGGGICLLMCLAGGFMLTTSQGDPKQVNEAKEMITSAIVGLLFIIFSVFILQFIGVTIFHIPGFGGAPATSP